MHVDRRLLGWGTFFVLLGAIPLATKAGLLDRDLIGQWPLLWPVLLIGWGLGLLLRGTPLALVGGAVSAITFGIMGGGALATGFGVEGCVLVAMMSNISRGTRIFYLDTDLLFPETYALRGQRIL